jgi:hypothetical protein
MMEDVSEWLEGRIALPVEGTRTRRIGRDRVWLLEQCLGPSQDAAWPRSGRRAVSIDRYTSNEDALNP